MDSCLVQLLFCHTYKTVSPNISRSYKQKALPNFASNVSVVASVICERSPCKIHFEGHIGNL